MLTLMYRIMMEGALFTGLHTRDLLIQFGYFCSEMPPKSDKIKMDAPPCIGLY
nr:hypothetical protein Iba_chr14bCG0780 [Ipomoea batatas]GMD91557.1 hypothetical protein Iba_chr14eCG0540 [Ipomoea batatas]